VHQNAPWAFVANTIAASTDDKGRHQVFDFERLCWTSEVGMNLALFLLSGGDCPAR